MVLGAPVAADQKDAADHTCHTWTTGRQRGKRCSEYTPKAPGKQKASWERKRTLKQALHQKKMVTPKALVLSFFVI